MRDKREKLKQEQGVMKLSLSVALLGLAWFALINVIATAAAWFAGRSLTRRESPSPAALLVVRLSAGDRGCGVCRFRVRPWPYPPRTA